MSSGLDARLERLARLGEPVRRALYRYVVGEPAPVSREQVAGWASPTTSPKFNLHRLVDDGHLEAEYRRPAGRGGPGRADRRSSTDGRRRASR